MSGIGIFLVIVVLILFICFLEQLAGGGVVFFEWLHWVLSSHSQLTKPDRYSVQELKDVMWQGLVVPGVTQAFLCVLKGL